jgi:hypothetical protein
MFSLDYSRRQLSWILQSLPSLLSPRLQLLLYPELQWLQWLLSLLSLLSPLSPLLLLLLLLLLLQLLKLQWWLELLLSSLWLQW